MYKDFYKALFSLIISDNLCFIEVKGSLFLSEDYL